MAEAYIYDAVRTPRGKGKNDGSLHEITSLQSGDAGAESDQGAQQARHRRWSMTWSSAASIRSASRRRHRAHRRVDGRLRQRRAGRADQPLLRLGARRVNFAAAR